MSKNRFIVITGPTASGKTQVSVQVAKRLQTEIVCADSMQIYKGIDIGTAKATEEQRQGITHYMLDIVRPNEDYSAAEFQRAAFLLIDQINTQGMVPIVSGGTGLYINSLVYRLDFGTGSVNKEIRQKYAQLADDKSVAYLYNILKEKDPEYTNIISANDKRRIIRRLEIIEKGGNPEYNFRRYNDNCDFLMIGLTMPRDRLYKRIDERVDQMMQKGFLDEARGVYNKYGDVNALQAIGYKELVSYIDGKYELEEAVELIKRNTRRYAKRQMTWFRRIDRIVWFDISNYSCIEDTINDIIIYIKRKGF